ncbi:MAG: Gfo/Idh/MocA family oxidoreductase [Microthrixaceae bacterium]|nr:Gfo/Idh/MocA family oxidoreductase [Microthrixaceae bacterium]
MPLDRFVPLVTRVAIAGAGWAGELHAAATERVPGARLVQILSRTTESAERTAATVGVPGVTYAELSSKAELVVVATPPAHHWEMATTALGRPMAVLVEKPLCSTLAEADALIDAAEAAGVAAGYAENLLFAPAIDVALAHRADGPLTHLSSRAAQPTPAWGHFVEPLTVGGALFDLGAHPVALALAFAKSEPVGVRARIDSNRDDGADDDASVRLRFADGLMAEIEVSWRASKPVWDLQASTPDRVSRVELLPNIAVELDGADATPEPTDPLTDFGYVGQLRGIVDVVSGLGGRVCPLGFGRLVLDVICGAYQSAGQGGLDGAEVPLPFGGPRDLNPMQLWQL